MRKGTTSKPLAGVAALIAVLLCALFAARAQKKPPAKPLDLNTATLEQLEQLPGIGPTTAKAIIDFREKSGPFERLEDLRAIRLISKSRLEKLRPYVTVAPPAKSRQPRIGSVVFLFHFPQIFA